MMKQVTVILSLILAAALAIGQTQDDTKDFLNYAEMRQYFGELYQQEKFKEASELLEYYLDRFPDKLMANSYNLALVYGHLEEYEKGIKVLMSALEHDLWFGVYAFEPEAWAPFKEIKGFEKVLSQNEVLRQKAQENAKPELVVITPENFVKNQKYPLFIALHGGNSNIANFKEVWVSETMNNEFITAYIQSSQVESMNGFGWTDDIEIAKKQIMEAYREIVQEYPIDEKEVIIGGFSSGGIAALEISFGNTLPVAGFIALCPTKPDGYNEASLLDAKKRGIRGTILTTEMDPRLEIQKEMVKMLESSGLKYRFVVTPNIGHWFPENLSVLIDDAIEHIRE